MGMHARFNHIPQSKLETICRHPDAFYKKNFSRKDSPELDAAEKFLREKGLQEKLASAMAAIPELKHTGTAGGRAKVLSPEESLAAQRKLMQAVPELGRLADVMHQARAEAGAPEPEPRAGSDARRAGLEKSWHSLHYLLTGSATEAEDTPLGRAILGGTEIPDAAKRMGYGPVRCLRPEQVQETAQALMHYPIEQRSREYDSAAAAAAQVYCPDFAPEELRHYFGILQAYYREAAGSSHGMLLWLE